MDDRNKSSEGGALDAVVIRMPADLHEAVKAKAAIQERSMAQAIRYALRQYLAAEPDPPCCCPGPLHTGDLPPRCPRHGRLVTNA